MQSHDDFLREIEDSENGHFLVENRDGRAFLRVDPPGRNGTPVRLRDVEARLALFHLSGYDRAHVEGIVADADGEAHDIAAWEMPEAIDAKLRAEVAADDMSAWLDVEPPRFGGRMPDQAGLEAILREAGVVAGIDEAVLGRIARGEFVRDSRAAAASGNASGADDASENFEDFNSQPDGSTKRRDPQRSGVALPRIPAAQRRFRALVARGRAATPGRPASIRHHFNPHPRAVPEVIDPSSRARVDFRKLNVIQTCKSGDLLAEALPGEAGADGFTVRGETLAPPPAGSVSLEAGRNTRKSEDGLQLFATIDGQVRIEEPPSGGLARIDVEEILDLENVDYSVGHVDFPGTVRISGSVLDGFEVKAAGDILIEKSVGNVRLLAGGDIVLQGGAACRNEGLIEAEGDVYARFVQDGGISARKRVYIEEAALNSRIVAGEGVYIEGGRGELMGGSTLAGETVRTRKLGSRMEALTQITVGVSPEIMERLQSLNREFAEKHRTLRRVEQHLSQFDEAVKRGRKLEAEDEATLEKLRTIREKYAGVLQNLEEQRKYLYTTIEPSPEAVVEAAEALYPGVEVYFGAGVKRYRVEGRAHFGPSRFTLEDGRIILRHS